MPPEVKGGQVKPSAYGMSAILVSPLLLWLIGKPYRDKRMWLASWAVVGVTSIPILLHFTQGWVQFGYRFMLDFIPFIMIILALRLPDKIGSAQGKLAVGLTIISVGVNWWGVEWAKRLGW